MPSDESLAPTAAVIGDRLQAAGVEIVRVVFPDLFGRARSKQYPLDELERLTGGAGFCEASLVENIHGVPLEGAAWPADLGFPDLHAVPDLRTARIAPWEPDTAWILADLHDGDGLSALCSRGLVRRAAARAAALGLTCEIATEPELYLVHVEPDESWRAYSPTTGSAYTTGARVDPSGVFGRLHRQLHRFGIGVTSANREFSPGQFEINLRHADLVTAADNGFLLKEGIKELAALDGLLATFMAKPFATEEGSSLHVHASLWRGEQNAFCDAGGELTPAIRAFAAGVLAHAPALTAFASPTVNSYKRLVPGGLAPTSASLGGDSRLTYLRIPGERGPATRLEVRCGDASASPYLLPAAILHAGLDGLERELELCEAAIPLPPSLGAALDALSADTRLVEALGPRLVDVFCALKRDELERSSRAVTDWERAEYGYHA